jgi:DNA helicase-2/ATP-dependent DNA helicase PcrA
VTIIPTAEQQRIIDYPLTVLRVAAGAGTGKTTTIAMRLAALVNRNRLEPEEALGITFTNKAAEELADRLRLHLPDLAAQGREVEVTTYHGFAHRLVAEFGPIVGVERDVTVIGSGYQRELLRESLGVTRTSLLDLTAPARRVDDLMSLSSRLGDQLRLPSEILALVADDDVAKERREMALVLDRYEELKRRLGVLDYADLIRFGHEIASDPSIASRVRDRYRVVLLDEYQDTNPAQRELLLRLFGGGFPVTAVGDPDQTIYEWRGASLENFASFPEHFTEGSMPATTLTLGLNRRSDRLVIDAANLVRVGGSGGIGRLEARPDAADGDVVAAWFHSATDEASWVAREVRRLHDEDGLEWREIALLFRKNRSIPLLREALEALDIPVEVAALGGLLQVPEVSDVHAWMRLIGRPDDGPALARVLLGSSYRLGLGDLAELATRRHAGQTLLEVIDEHHETLGARISLFRQRYRALLTLAQGVTLVELARRILDVNGTWAEVEALDGARRLSTRLNLYRFLDLTEEWSPLEGRPSLDAFLDYLDLLQQDAATEELDTATLSGEDAVSLMTVHRSKGLEWSAVFLPAVCHGTFPSFAHGGLDDPARFARSLPVELRLDEPNDPRRQHEEQEWRTAYVGVSRAKHRLTLTGAYWYTIGRPKKPSRLYELLAHLEGAEVIAFATEPGDPPQELRSSLPTATPDPLFTDGWEATFARAAEDPSWLRSLVDDDDAFDMSQRQLRLAVVSLPAEPDREPAPAGLQVSVSNLVAYATCPKRYFWTAVDPLPRRPSAAARRGVEIHRRIELYSLGVIPFTEPGGYDVPEAAFGGDPYGVYVSSRFARARPRLVETPFTLLLATGVTIGGRIDAVYEPAPGIWEVVDFKTGRPSTNPAVKVQLEAYAVAALEAGLSSTPPRELSVTFAYLGDRLEEVTEAVSDDWLTDARDHLGALSTQIGEGRFPTTPSPACRWCDFQSFCEPGRAYLDAHEVR